MENKINIAALLKDCPKGMELDCTMFDNVTFVRVDDKRKQFPVEIAVGGLRSKYLTKDGCFHDNTLIPEAKCVIFPKGKTTWDGFHRPFDDGDIVYSRPHKIIGIYHHKEDEPPCVSHCRYNEYHKTFEILNNDIYIAKQDYRLATKEEKQKLLDAIKANGYKWNTETKTLEKLIQPKFKVGDRVRHKTHIRQENAVTEIKDTHYVLDDELALPFISQDEYELAPNKFDINTLIPFESKVLVREGETDVWQPAFYGFFHQRNKRFYTANSSTWLWCIPYNEDTKHLTGTTNDCDDFYKTWE